MEEAGSRGQKGGVSQSSDERKHQMLLDRGNRRDRERAVKIGGKEPARTDDERGQASSGTIAGRREKRADCPTQVIPTMEGKVGVKGIGS